MAGLIERARAGEFPLYSFCIFEVLERCPDERSGPDLEQCPECPLMPWCHEDRDVDPRRPAEGEAVGRALRDRRADPEGPDRQPADLRGRLPLPGAEGRRPLVPGLRPGRQRQRRGRVRPRPPGPPGDRLGRLHRRRLLPGRPAAGGDRRGTVDQVHVFADYLAEGKPAERNARAILEVGPAALQRADRRGLDRPGRRVAQRGRADGARRVRAAPGSASLEWPGRSRASVADGLALIESFLRPADGGTRLLVHPRCQDTIRAFQDYRRARRGGQWTDQPEDPQHPHEELMDALRGGLRVPLPRGPAPEGDAAEAAGAPGLLSRSRRRTRPTTERPPGTSPGGVQRPDT